MIAGWAVARNNARGRVGMLSAPAGNKTTTPHLSVVTILTELLRIQSIILFKKMKQWVSVQTITHVLLIQKPSV